MAGFQVPVIPLGEVSAKTGAVSALHKVRLVGKSVVTFAVTVKLIISVICNPQLFVAVKVMGIVCPADPAGIV